MLERPWFERWPERLERELQALGRADVSVEVDADVRARGILVMHVEMPAEGPCGGRLLTAVFPAEYPFFRPAVFAPGLQLVRHQNPFDSNLCLLQRATVSWNPEDTLWDLLDEQLPKVLQRGPVVDPEVLAQYEGEQAEPRSTYYEYESGSFVLWDPGHTVPDEVLRGVLVLEHSNGGRPFRGSLVRLRDDRGTDLYNARPLPEGLFPGRTGFRWVRTSPPPVRSAPEMLRWLRGRYPWSLERLEQGIKWEGGSSGVVGILYQEEVGPGRFGDAWLFLVRETDGQGRSRVYLARPAAYSEALLFDRAPELAFLRTATVAQAGAGCIGAPLALDLARAGVARLQVMDPDVVEAGTTVRWPLGLRAVGQPKVEVLASLVRSSYPFTDFTGVPWRLGQASRDLDLCGLGELMNAWLREPQIIVDTTAEWGVHFYLSELARSLGIPYVVISGTQGGWGGTVYRVMPEGGPCWGCFERWQEGEDFPLPASLTDEGRVQPRGCADPTFTGASFDLGQIALAGARFVVMTLATALGGGYPDVPWNFATVSFRTETGLAIAPAWETHELGRHPDCERCDLP